MKKVYMSIALMVLCSSFAAAQANLPDPMSAPPSNSNFYYENHGQIVDENGNLHPEIRYYTEHTYPEMYLANDKISFVATRNADTSIPGDVDSIGRIDLQFLCNKGAKSQIAEKPTAFMPCGTMAAFEPSQDHLNYYLPQCPNGITNVPGYARVVYENAFPNIDVHFYSNAVAVKVFFVVKPGGNPSDIDLLFTGQDSIGSIGSSLAMYFGPWELQLPQALAYQITPSNNTTVLGWLPTWVHNGNGEVTLGSIGSYNTSEDLVISIGGPVQQPTSGDNLEWATYYGDNGPQMSAHIYSDDKGNLFHALAEGGSVFPSLPGAGTNPNQASTNHGWYDWYVSMFDPIGKRLWATYYGGSFYDYPTAIDVYGSQIWVAGFTRSVDVPLGTGFGTFKQTANAGLSSQTYCRDGLLAYFDWKDGTLQYGTYFGGGGQSEDMISDMTIDKEKGQLYIAGTNEGITSFNNTCGSQTTGSFPLCSGSGNCFFQGTKSLNTDKEGFIAEFNLENRSLVWSTLFGGYGPDEIQTIVHHENELYIGGLTYSANIGGDRDYPSPITSHPVSDFPLANPGGNAFFQTSSNSNHVNQFLEKFNSDYQLEWGTLFGASWGGTRTIAFSPGGNLYAYFLGVLPQDAALLSSSPNNNGLVPIFHTGNAYYEQPTSNIQQALIASFDQDMALNWSTYLHSYGGNGSHSPETYTSGLAIDNSGRIFVGTYMDNEAAPVFYLNGAYWQSQNASNGLNDPNGNDNYILSFNSGNELTWGTFLGGAYLPAQLNVKSTDGISDVAISGSKYLFITGWTECPAPESPYDRCPSGAYCDLSYNPSSDCYIGRFNISDYPIQPPNTGIKEQQLNISTLTVHPNPSPDLVNVSFVNTNIKLKHVTLTVCDQLGRMIRNSNMAVIPGINQLKINMHGFSSGLYYLEISGGDTVASTKFVKL